MSPSRQPAAQVQVLFIGQAPPRRPGPHPYHRSRLYNWLDPLYSDPALQWRELFASLIDIFPGKQGSRDRAPTRAMIKRGMPQLIRALQEARPDIVVPLGVLATREIIADRNAELVEVVGTVIRVNPLSALTASVPTIPLPHPSTGSTWVHLNENHKALRKAIALLREHILAIGLPTVL